MHHIRPVIPFSLVVLIVGLAGCSLGPFSTGELRFLQHGNVVRTEGMVGPRTVSRSELGPVAFMPLLGSFNPLTAIDFSGVNVSLAPIDNQGLPGRQVEAHLFVDDLSATNDFLRFVGAASPVQPWDERAGVAHRGQTMVVPFPPHPGWSLNQRWSVGPPFLPVWFWGAAQPAESALTADGHPSIKAVRFYRAGLCSTEVAFTQANQRGVFDEISNQLFGQFAANESLDRGSAVRAYSRVTALLDDDIDAFGPQGGFLLFFWFRASAAGGLQSVNFAANYDYAFTLVDGRVALVPKRNDLLVQPQQRFLSFANALEITLPKAVAETFERQQQAPPRAEAGQTETAQLCGGPDPTRLGRELFKAAAMDGGQKLGYSAADQQRLGAAISQPHHWRCDGDRARFILRAKRINIYGDAIELVWFDEVNLDDPMYALYAASVSQQQPQALCSRPRTIVGGTGPRFRNRPLVTVAR